MKREEVEEAQKIIKQLDKINQLLSSRNRKMAIFCNYCVNDTDDKLFWDRLVDLDDDLKSIIINKLKEKKDKLEKQLDEL